MGTQICHFGDPEAPFWDPGGRFWPLRGAQGQPRGPLWAPGDSIGGPWGTIFGMQGSTGTAQRTPVGPDVDFDRFLIDFWGCLGLQKQCFRVGAVAKTTFSASRDFDAKMVDFGGLGQQD